MNINYFQPIWKILENNAFLLCRPEKLLQISALGKLILEYQSDKLPRHEVITLLCQQGYADDVVNTAYNEISALMQVIKLCENKAAAPPNNLKPFSLRRYQARFKLLTKSIHINTNSNHIISLAKSIWFGHEITSHSTTSDIRITIEVDSEHATIYRDGDFKSRAKSRADIKSMLVQEVMYGLHELEDWVIVLHASAVSYKSRLIAFVGPSGSGKSTLAAILTAQGAELFSDDCVPIRSDNLNAATVPGAMGLRPEALPALRSWLPEVAKIPLSGPSDDPRHYWTPATMPKQLQRRIDHIVFCRYDKSVTAAMQALGKDEGLVRLLNSGSGMAQLRNLEQLERLFAWINNVHFWAIEHNDTEQALAYIDCILKQEL